MAKAVKALNQSWKKNIGNAYEKVNIVRQHRTHRSKKGRKASVAFTPLFLKKKRQIKEDTYDL